LTLGFDRELKLMIAYMVCFPLEQTDCYFSRLLRDSKIYTKCGVVFLFTFYADVIALFVYWSLEKRRIYTAVA